MRPLSDERAALRERGFLPAGRGTCVVCGAAAPPRSNFCSHSCAVRADRFRQEDLGGLPVRIQRTAPKGERRTRPYRCPVCCSAGFPGADKRCHNCRAQAVGKRTWTRDEERIVLDRWGLYSATQVQSQLAAAGYQRTLRAIVARAHRLGLDAHRPDGFVSVPELAHEHATHANTVRRTARRLGITLGGTGQAHLVTLRDADRIAAALAPYAEPTVSTREAADRLGYHPHSTTKLVRTGALRGVKHRGAYRVSLAHIEAVEAELRRTGAVRMDWKGQQKCATISASKQLTSGTMR